MRGHSIVEQGSGQQQMQELNGKVAAIVGGSGGIGAAAARMLAEAGATVAIGYHSNRDKALALAGALDGTGHSVFPVAVDDSQSVVEAARIVLDTHGRTDILVNAAGTTRQVPHADLDGLSDELLDTILIGNVRGPFSAIRAFAPALRASGDGVIVNISSISGFTGSGSSVGYCASKGALDTMTLSLARALGPEIRVLCVSPGAVATDFLPGRGREQLARIAASTPLKRIVEPEDVARAVMACITHLRATTGARIIVDGGRFLV
jgi:3-oxoacyl-[acyl-carrier protein] reductase